MADGTPTLPTDAAAKVLNADLRNTVAKVAAGERLPEADRARLETTVLADADSEAVARLAKERLANLLKIWSSGRRRLTPAELAEIEPVLPRSVLVRQPIAEVSYKQLTADYAVLYGVAERTIKEWKSLGRLAKPEPELPPLDDPPRMKDWYARHKKNRVPDRLVQLASQAARLEAGENAEKKPAPVTTAAAAPKHPDTCPDPPPTPPANSKPPPVSAASDIAQGFTATLDRLRKAEAAAGEKYTNLQLAEGKESEAEQARRSWQQLTKDLRAYEKDAEEVLQKSGQSWIASDALAAIYEVHVPLRDSLLSLYDRIETKLEGMNRTERRRFYREEVRRAFAALVTNRFTAVAVPAEQ